MMLLYVSYLYTCSCKRCHNIIRLIFRPQQHVANPRVLIPFTAVWLNLLISLNSSQHIKPTHRIMLCIMADILQFPSFPQILYLWSVYRRIQTVIKARHRKVCWLAFPAASHQQAGTTPNVWCPSSARSLAIFGEKLLSCLMCQLQRISPQKAP